VDNSLLEQLRNVRNYLDNPFFLSNPFYRLTKPTPENLSKYRNYEKGSLRLRTKYNFLILIPIAFTQSAWNILLSILTPWEWFASQRLSNYNFEILGISQVTRANQRFENDPLYGEIPRLLTKDKHLGMFYLNGTRKIGSDVRAALTKEKNQEVIVNSKTLSPVATTKLILKNFSAVLRLIFELKTNKLTTESELYLISEGLIFQFRRATFANLILLQRLIEVLKYSSTQSIFFTIEGHAHEAMIIDLVKSRFPQIRIKAIQHAPIVPDQVGFFDNLLRLRKIDSVLCTGKTMKEVTASFLLNSDAACKDVRIIGSSKSCSSIDQDNKLFKNKTQSMLILPEGTESSTIEFLDLFYYLANRHPRINFVFRTHPATRKSAKLKRQMAKILPVNAKFSQNSLIGDFEEAWYCIYRSSASAIEALPYGIIPIHFQSSIQFDLDPISNEHLVHPKAQNYADLDGIIDGLPNSHASLSSNSTKMYEYYRDFYFPLNVDVLEES